MSSSDAGDAAAAARSGAGEMAAGAGRADRHLCACGRDRVEKGCRRPGEWAGVGEIEVAGGPHADSIPVRGRERWGPGGRAAPWAPGSRGIGFPGRASFFSPTIASHSPAGRPGGGGGHHPAGRGRGRRAGSPPGAGGCGGAEEEHGGGGGGCGWLRFEGRRGRERKPRTHITSHPPRPPASHAPPPFPTPPHHPRFARMLAQASASAATAAARRPLASTSHRGGAALRAVVTRRPGRAHARRAPVAAQANELNKW